MEYLKKIVEIVKPDVRQNCFVKIDVQNGTFHPFTLEDFHQKAKSIKLHASVPENIRSHFATARNLIVYSWFYYPFNVTAQFIAYTTVEFALRTKFNDRRTNFKNLLKKAIDAGLITDRGFSDRVRKVKHIRENNAVLLPDFHLPEPKLMREYADTLVESIPFLRNQIAHGTNMLHEQGAKHVRICAELINQLFPSTPIN
jgi:hypothetical protein